ncbi:MAG: CRTAC1 family protein, partial [Acidobacteria bacterium]|nr:CRTAC1 family protein [Acidobacteriota bacterium]
FGSAVIDDFDNDGYLDIFTTTFDIRDRIHFFHNQRDGTFLDRTAEAGLAGLYGGINTDQADYNNDGFTDLYVLRGAWMQAMGRHPNSLIRNNGDGTFTDVAAAAGVENMQFAKAVIWGDYDDDRYPDLYVSNFGHLNRLYHNEGDGTFVDVAKQAGVTLPILSFAIWFWDVNNDDALDLFVAAYGSDMASVAASYLGMGDRGGGELPYLYLGDGQGGFRDVAREWNIMRPTLPMGNNFGDLDNDGFLDFYLGTGYPSYEALVPNRMYRNRGGSGFAEVTTAGNFGHLQKGHAVVFADFDNDGDEDVFQQMGGAWAGDAYGNAFYLNPGFGHHWIKLSLVGVRTNRFGLGARIRVDIVEDGQPRSIYRRVSSGASFGGNPFRREIGVGSATVIDAIEIYWPASDTTQRFEDVDVDQWIEVTEGESDYRVLPLHAFTLGGS